MKICDVCKKQASGVIPYHVCEDCSELTYFMPELKQLLMDLLEWAKGNRGSKTINPYAVPEVKQALKVLAKIQGITKWLDAQTAN
jgi:hypothetical protein